MFNNEKVKIGIAPIGWTNDDMPDLGKENTFEQCVSEMALAGYAGCEIGNKYPQEKEVLKKALNLRNITICNQWFSTFLISKPFEETAKPFEEKLDFLKYLGAKVIGVSEQSYSIQGKDQPIFEGKHVMNDHEWELLCSGLNKLGKIAKDKGMKLTFHHHMGTVVQNEDEIDRLMEHTNPDLVYLLFDTGHLGFNNIDPVKVLKKYIYRIGHVHLKDLRADVVKEAKAKHLSFLDGVRSGTFTVPGDGNVDFKPIFNILENSGYEGWMVVEAEQDPAKANPFEYALKSRKYIKQNTGI